MYERYRAFVIVCMLSSVFRYQTSRHLQLGICPMQEQNAGLYVESNHTIRACVAQYFSVCGYEKPPASALSKRSELFMFINVSACATLSLVNDISQRFSRSFYFQTAHWLVSNFPFSFFYAARLRNQLMYSAFDFLAALLFKLSLAVFKPFLMAADAVSIFCAGAPFCLALFEIDLIVPIIFQFLL